VVDVALVEAALLAFGQAGTVGAGETAEDLAGQSTLVGTGQRGGGPSVAREVVVDDGTRLVVGRSIHRGGSRGTGVERLTVLPGRAGMHGGLRRSEVHGAVRVRLVERLASGQQLGDPLVSTRRRPRSLTLLL